MLDIAPDRLVATSSPVPRWEELRLESRAWTLFWNAQVLELRLERAGALVCSALATPGSFLVHEAAAPQWARELVEEAAMEWRRGLVPNRQITSQQASGSRTRRD